MALWVSLLGIFQDSPNHRKFAISWEILLIPDFWLNPREAEAKHAKPQLSDILNKAYFFFNFSKRKHSSPTTTHHDRLPILSSPQHLTTHTL